MVTMKTHLRKETMAELEQIRSIFPFKPHFKTLSHPMDMGAREQDATVHYVDEGEGEPIVFIHGNPTWSFYFRKVILKLKDHHRCVALDHIGCGLSEKDPSFRYDLKSRGIFLERFLDELGIQKCHLVVHDWGGSIGMAFATRNPERVASVTITNTAAFPSKWISWRIQMCRLPIAGRWINYHLNGFLKAAMVMTTLAPLPKLVKQGYRLPYRKLEERESIDQFVKDIPMSKSHPTYEELERIGEQLSNIKDQQVMILWGLRDFCFAKLFFDEWKTRFPTSKAVAFEDADHFLFEEKADECADLMLNHLNENRI